MISPFFSANLATLTTLTPTPVCLPSHHHHIPPSTLSIPGSSLPLHQQQIGLDRKLNPTSLTLDKESATALALGYHHHLQHHFSKYPSPGANLPLDNDYRNRLQELVAAAPATLVPQLEAVEVVEKDNRLSDFGGIALDGDANNTCWKCPFQGCRLSAMCRCLRIIQACCKVCKARVKYWIYRRKILIIQFLYEFNKSIVFLEKNR